MLSAARVMGVPGMGVSAVGTALGTPRMSQEDASESSVVDGFSLRENFWRGLEVIRAWRSETVGLRVERFGHFSCIVLVRKASKKGVAMRRKTVTYDFPAIGPPFLVKLDIDAVLFSFLALASSQNPCQGLCNLDLSGVDIADCSRAANTPAMLSTAVSSSRRYWRHRGCHDILMS